MITLLISLIILGFFLNSLWIWSYFIRKGIPGPRGVPGVGMLATLLDQEISPFFKIFEWTKQYGRVYGFTEGTQKTLVISEPVWVYEIFVKQFDNFYGRKHRPIIGNPDKAKLIHMFSAHGKQWKRLRTLASPSFSNNSLRKVKSRVEECAVQILWHIEKGVQKGDELDMLRFYQEYSMEVICRLAMGQTESQMFKNPLVKKVKAVVIGSSNMFLITGLFPPLAYLVRNLANFLPASFVPAFRLFDTAKIAVSKRIAEREADERAGIDPGESQDFIDLFLDARADDVEHFGENNEDFTKAGVKVTRQMTMDEIVGQCFLFLIAAFDTTSLTLSYATWLLAMNPRVQEKLQEEIDNECPDPDITFDQLSKLKYMEAALKETSRLYPLGVAGHARECMRDTTVNGLKIEKGVNIQVDTWTLHHDKTIWGDDVEEFKPERWLTDTADQYEHSGAYIPFGYGPRQCIGIRLAYMEQKIILAQILRKFSFRRSVSTQVPLKMSGIFTISPESVFVKLEPRD